MRDARSNCWDDRRAASRPGHQSDARGPAPRLERHDAAQAITAPASTWSATVATARATPPRGKAHGQHPAARRRPGNGNSSGRSSSSATTANVSSPTKASGPGTPRRSTGSSQPRGAQASSTTPRTCRQHATRATSRRRAPSTRAAAIGKPRSPLTDPWPSPPLRGFVPRRVVL